MPNNYSERYNLDVNVEPKIIFGVENYIGRKTNSIPRIIHQTAKNDSLPNVLKESIEYVHHDPIDTGWGLLDLIGV